MINACPNALSLAVAFAISASIMSTQALADRRLLTRSIDIPGNGQTEFTQTEVMVQPTSGHDRQPIPKSCTTTYLDQIEVQIRAGIKVIYEGFTDVLADIGGSVYSVDIFETDDNGVAQKYTKILKVGDESVFRFIHNLAESKLVIEVREGMTDQAAIEAVRAQSGDIQPLEPATKIATTQQFVGIMKGAYKRAGNLGETDDYVDLVTIEVDPVEVKGRTFMRLIAAGDQPPDLQRLGQSLFVNDEVLLAAATSAYTQVHVLGEKVQHAPLASLLSYHRPVGYVVHVEDDTLAYPVPTDYPKLEVEQASEEIIVFRGQKQNPTDIAFVESHYSGIREEYRFKELPAKVKTFRIKNYQQIIRSRQMALLEEFAADLAAQHGARLDDDKLLKLGYYESLLQALTSAAPDKTYEFEFTTDHIRAAASVITPVWVQFQLIKNFSFKPVLKNLLTNRNFVQSIWNIQRLMPYDSGVINDFGVGEKTKFSSKVMDDISGQLLEMVNTQEKLLANVPEFARAVKTSDGITTARATDSGEEKLKAELIRQKFEAELKELRNSFQVLKNTVHKFRQDINQIPALEKQVSNAIADTTKARHAHAAALLGIDDWDDTRPLEEQARLLNKKLYEINHSMAATKPFREQPYKETLAAIEGQLDIVPYDENDLSGRSEFILTHLQQQAGQSDEVFRYKLAVVEAQLGLVPDEKDGPQARQDNIRKYLWLKCAWAHQQDLEHRLQHPHIKQQQAEIAKQPLQQQSTSADAERDRTPDHPGVRPEVLMKLRAVEKALKMDDLKGGDNSEDNVHQRRDAISEKIQSYATKAIEVAEEEALHIVETLEEILKIEVNKEDNKATRLARVQDVLRSCIPKYMLREVEAFIWKIRMTWSKEEKVRVWNLIDFLDINVETPDPDERVLKQQIRMLEALENELKIDKSENPAAIKRGREAAAELALPLKVEFAKGASLNDQKDALKASIQALREEVNHLYHLYCQDEDLPREGYDKIARQLDIKNFKHFHFDDEKEKRIETELRWLDRDVDLLGQPEVNERIAVIENELDRQIAPGAEPRYIPDPELATEERAPKAAVEEVKNDDGSFQYTSAQAEVLHAIQTFMQQHPLKRQALQVANGLAELAVMNGKAIPNLPTYDFDEEFAALRLQVLVGDKLTFDQTSRIVQIFRDMKATFPEYPASEDEPRCPLEEVQKLVQRARNEMGSGAREYDKEIFGMGKSAIHFLGREPDDLKTFPEDFTTHSASVNRIITLLHEGLINKVELWNYIKAVRGIDGYQTVDEFEHFLGYKHNVKLTHFRAAVRLLSDKGVEKFILSAFPAVTATGPVAMKESVVGMKEYAAAVIANYVLDDIAFDNGRRTAAFLTNVQDTLTPYVNAAGLSETELIKTIHGTLMQAHAAAVEYQLNDYWVKPSAFLVQAVTWYFSSYKPLLATHTTGQATALSLSNMSFLYLLDLTNRGDYTHRMLIPFQHWLEDYGVDLDRTGQHAYHSEIEKISEVGGLAMPLGKAASSVILLRTGSMLFARQYNANPQMYRSISRLVPEIVKSMGSGQGVQVPLLHRATAQQVKTLASATAGLVLGPVATVGAYAHGLISGFTYAQTFGFALASSLTFDFFMNDNKLLTQWLGGPLGRSLDKMNRWIGLGETQDEYLKRTTIASPQRFNENDEAYTNRVKANNTMHGWTRHEHYLQFRERRDRTMKLFENGWEKYFRDNVPKWSFSHAESIPYSYTLGAFSKWRQGDDKKVHVHDKRNASPIRLSSQL
ncbi:hypothetical protein [Endozoicomonas sp. 8E]|uniref:hypothetical protein n=1 Tax=Endozoicomonas sp. 8E TaxID=3035692 RepID=UPI002938FC24|nr:hypothetical protein [Endozoicomonas sp. 8E]WOG29616.1 hypothetical protein P6910_08170 [Endozoicomonas sp. 8E]